MPTDTTEKTSELPTGRFPLAAFLIVYFTVLALFLSHTMAADHF
jgi:hypothetical protein